jgi:hypothetical protein
MMKPWRNIGIWIWVALILLVGLFPIVQKSDATREVIFTI